jgi:exosome complex RNA-binding protein Rrp42 (RNase PH superfamily)
MKETLGMELRLDGRKTLFEHREISISVLDKSQGQVIVSFGDNTQIHCRTSKRLVNPRPGRPGEGIYNRSQHIPSVAERRAEWQGRPASRPESGATAAA